GGVHVGQIGVPQVVIAHEVADVQVLSAHRARRRTVLRVSTASPREDQHRGEHRDHDPLHISRFCLRRPLVAKSGRAGAVPSFAKLTRYTRFVSFLKRWAIRLAVAVALVLGTLIIGGAFDARRRHPDLKPWHRLVPHDVHATELDDGFTLERWLRGEPEVFGEVAAMEDGLDPVDRTPVNRYFPSSRTHYSR